MRIKLSPFAEQDLDETIDYYSTQNNKLSNEFVSAVDLVFDSIKNNGNQFPKSYGGTRKAKLQKFPFNIFFVAEKEIAYIVGIYHTSRNPSLLKNRLT